MIAHWPGLPAKLSGKVIGIEHGKYYVEYDDGDKHHNTIDQLRILKPPLYFGEALENFTVCLLLIVFEVRPLKYETNVFFFNLKPRGPQIE